MVLEFLVKKLSVALFVLLGALSSCSPAPSTSQPQGIVDSRSPTSWAHASEYGDIETDPWELHFVARRLAARYVRENGGEISTTHIITNFIDLNGDGQKDIIATLDNPQLCTQKGCPLAVFENTGDSLSLVSVTKDVHVRLGHRESDTGWLTLNVATKDTTGTTSVAGEPAKVYLLAHDGNGYPGEVTQGQENL